MLSERQHPEREAILDIARDLTASLKSENRYVRLLSAICRVIPCDAACLMRVDEGTLRPLAARGLSSAALARTYVQKEHPRLNALVSSMHPVRFPSHSSLPDPFDGLVAGAPHALDKVHDCMGCALIDDGEVVGVLTLDAFEAGSFDRVDRQLLATLAALAGATLRTSSLLDALEERVERQQGVTAELSRSSSVSLIGDSPALERVRTDVEIVAPSDLSLLISGETGVGKELVARLVHERSARSSYPLVQVNCAALPENLAEDELFGHVAGAFTGATRDRVGKFEAAEGGTLFLDEIGELPPFLQSKLLIALQDGQIQRVGSDRPKRVNVRVLAATNRKLEDEVAEGRFRADLFHRLAAFPLIVPALRDRAEDIPSLIRFFGERSERRLGTRPVRFADSFVSWCQQQSWPGNVRELQNVVERAILRARHEHSGRASLEIQPHHAKSDAVAAPKKTPAARQTMKQDTAPLRDRVVGFQRREVERALQDNRGCWAGAARDLKMHRSNLHHLAKRLGMLPSR